MTEFDKEYLKLLKEILQRGEEVENRTGVNTIKIDKYAFKFDLAKEFPILMTKQLFSRQAITEMLWIWQMASNDVRELHKRNVHIWDEWISYLFKELCLRELLCSFLYSLFTITEIQTKD